jgi:hypothetical protein
MSARRYSQTGDGGGFRMLKRYHGRSCECCTDPNPGRTYRWHAFRYCITCLHSIGVNAAGNPCTPKQYRDAWRKLAA